MKTTVSSVKCIWLVFAGSQQDDQDRRPPYGNPGGGRLHRYIGGWAQHGEDRWMGVLCLRSSGWVRWWPWGPDPDTTSGQHPNTYDSWWADSGGSVNDDSEVDYTGFTYDTKGVQSDGHPVSTNFAGASPGTISVRMVNEWRLRFSAPTNASGELMNGSSPSVTGGYNWKPSDYDHVQDWIDDVWDDSLAWDDAWRWSVVLARNCADDVSKCIDPDTGEPMTMAVDNPKTMYTAEKGKAFYIKLPDWDGGTPCHQWIRNYDIYGSDASRNGTVVRYSTGNSAGCHMKPAIRVENVIHPAFCQGGAPESNMGLNDDKSSYNYCIQQMSFFDEGSRSSAGAQRQIYIRLTSRSSYNVGDDNNANDDLGRVFENRGWFGYRSAWANYDYTNSGACIHVPMMPYGITSRGMEFTGSGATKHLRQHTVGEQATEHSIGDSWATYSWPADWGGDPYSKHPWSYFTGKHSYHQDGGSGHAPSSTSFVADLMIEPHLSWYVYSCTVPYGGDKSGNAVKYEEYAASITGTNSGNWAEDWDSYGKGHGMQTGGDYHGFSMSKNTGLPGTLPPGVHFDRENNALYGLCDVVGEWHIDHHAEDFDNYSCKASFSFTVEEASEATATTTVEDTSVLRRTRQGSLDDDWSSLDGLVSTPGLVGTPEVMPPSYPGAGEETALGNFVYDDYVEESAGRPRMVPPDGVAWIPGYGQRPTRPGRPPSVPRRPTPMPRRPSPEKHPDIESYDPNDIKTGGRFSDSSKWDRMKPPTYGARRSTDDTGREAFSFQDGPVQSGQRGDKWEPFGSGPWAANNVVLRREESDYSF